MRRHLATLLIFAAAAACSDGSTGPLGPSELRLPDRGEAPNPLDGITTLAEQPAIAVGQTAKVRCYTIEDGQFLMPVESVTVAVYPDPGNVSVSGNSATFTPTASGTYRATCRTSSGSAADPDGALIDVSAGLPFSWVVDLPDYDCFSQTTTLPVEWTVLDSYGNEIVNAPIDALVIPNEGVLGDVRTGFRFTQEGTYDLTLSVAGPHDSGAILLPATMSFRVDSTPPVVDITSPASGAMIEAGGTGVEPVPVSGYASDTASGLAVVRINGEDLPVDTSIDQVTFDTVHSSRWGLSIVEGHVEDGCGNAAFIAHSYLRSGEYYPATTTSDPSARVADGMLAQLSQTLVDDGDRSDIDDLATLIETAISSYDFNAMLTPGQLLTTKQKDSCSGCPIGPIGVSVGYEAYRHPSSGRRINIAGPWIQNIDFVAGGLDFGIRADDFEFPLLVDMHIGECTVGCERVTDYTIDADVGFESLEISGNIGMDLWQGDAYAAVDTFNFDIEGAYIDFHSCGIFDWACDSIANLLIGAVEEKVEEAVEEMVAMNLPPMLEETLEGFGVEPALDLPSPLDMTLNVAASLDRVNFCGPFASYPVPNACHGQNTQPGSVGLGLGMQFYPAVRDASIPYDSKGSIKLPAVDPKMSSQSSFGLAVKTDLLNQLFWALWYGGAFDIPDLKAVMPDPTLAPDGFEGGLRAALPPVIMPGEGQNLFELGLGDLRMAARVDVGTFIGGEGAEPYYLDMVMHVSAIIGMVIDFDNEAGVINIAVDPEPQLSFYVESMNDFTYASFMGEALGTMISRELPAMLNSAVTAVEMPSFDMSIIPGVPAGTVWSLEDANLTHEDGYLTFTGSIGTN